MFLLSPIELKGHPWASLKITASEYSVVVICAMFFSLTQCCHWLGLSFLHIFILVSLEDRPVPIYSKVTVNCHRPCQNTAAPPPVCVLFDIMFLCLYFRLGGEGQLFQTDSVFGCVLYLQASFGYRGRA